MKSLTILLSLLLGIAAPAIADDRPNILWITIEDWSPDLSCYGTKGIATPHVDQLASEGIRYEHAFTTSPVCSTSRSAMMTGFHQNYIEANQHREHNKKPLPHGIKPLPHLFAEAGYYTALMSWKTDCNFLPDGKGELFMGEDWAERKEGQPFFARITFGGTHRAWTRDPQRPIAIEDVEIPPYYPDTEFVRRDWANGLEQMQLVDREVGEILKRLDDEGLRENTIVFFIGDHGRCHIRGKQFLYDGGIRIPMIMRWPGKVAPAQVSNDLVMSIDIGATILEAAGIEAPVPLHGKNLLSDAITNRKYVFAARDKMDETHDAMRSIRSQDHKLILNLMPERAWCQYNHYKEGAYPVLAEMNVMNLKGELTPAQAAFFAPTKPEIELFDLRKDPHEVNNVADDPAYAEIRTGLLAELEKWRTEVILDKGVTDEFRALNVFPETLTEPTVEKWVAANQANYDFDTVGWPAWYPTRSLEEWEKARKLWEPYVFRGPDEKVARPNITTPKKKAPKTQKKISRAADTNSFIGNWALTLDDGKAGWMPISKNPDGWNAQIWMVGQNKAVTDINLTEGKLTFIRQCKVGEPDFPGGPPTGERVPCRCVATTEGDTIEITLTAPDKAPVIYTGKRMPPMPDAPDLSKIEFGAPVELFNGEDLSGWTLSNPDQINGWKAVDGVLENETPKKTFDPFSRYGNLHTKERFGDGNLTIEFKVPPGGNSGIYVRGAYEAQVVDRDSRMQGIQGVGAIFGCIEPTKNAGKEGDVWQSYDITIVDRHATVILNGEKVIDNEPVIGNTNGAFQSDITKPGPLYLQGDHTSVSFRNIVFRPVVK